MTFFHGKRNWGNIKKRKIDIEPVFEFLKANSMFNRILV